MKPTEMNIIAIYERVDEPRRVERHQVHIPLALAVGRYEDLTERELTDIISDMEHEKLRRADKLRAIMDNRQATDNWNPFAAIRR